MKICTYCGKEYPDEAEVCDLDHEPLQSQGFRTRRVAQQPTLLWGFQVFPILASLTMFGFSIYGMSFVIDEIKSGWAYSPGVVFGDSTKIYASNSPAAYWVSVGLPLLGLIAGLILPFFGLREALIARKKKVEADANEKVKHDA